MAPASVFFAGRPSPLNFWVLSLAAPLVATIPLFRFFRNNPLQITFVLFVTVGLLLTSILLTRRQVRHGRMRIRSLALLPGGYRYVGVFRTVEGRWRPNSNLLLSVGGNGLCQAITLNSGRHHLALEMFGTAASSEEIEGRIEASLRLRPAGTPRPTIKRV